MDDLWKTFIHQCRGFDWDTGNLYKNWAKHKVSPSECEQVFFNLPLLLMDDTAHSQNEKRFYILGKTDARRKLFIAFTLRNNLIRVISARDMSRKEREVYDNA
jgi:uncharacterized DUF497 family protein